MKHTEDTARQLCAIDLRQRGIDEERIPELVERFWPVLANEIRQGIADDPWPYAVDEINSLSVEYRTLLG
ncbi:hypothetical protein [Ancylobacter sp.]|uniref:hypothetical protein n=1 Tax=Ancylobacter sp. TaxID=1872567 RepID=UPI003D0A58CB